MTQKTPRKPQVKLSAFHNGRDANNLAEWPLALLTDTVPEGLKTIEFQDTIDDWKSGKTLTRRVCITGSDMFGLPTAKDEEVLFALLQLTMLENNFQNPEVTFNKNQIIELLGWPKTGWAYRRVEESLHRWKDVSIHFWNSWRDHRNKQWKNSEALGVIEYFKFNDTRVGVDDGEVKSRFVWNKALFDSFQSGYLRKIDFAVFRSLSRPAAKRAFRFLGKRFHFAEELEFDLQTFACEKLGFSREYDTGQLKERLRPALGELEQIGFIKPVEYRKSRPKAWTIKLEQGQAAKKAKRANLRDLPPIVSHLVERGVEAEIAAELAAEYEEVMIREQITIFDQLLARNDKGVSKNPPGFLVSSIRRTFKWDKNTKSKPPKAPIAAAKPTDVAEPPIDPLTASIRKQVQALSVEEQSNLEAEAIATAGKITADSYYRLQAKGGALFDSLRDELLVTQLRKRLASPEVDASKGSSTTTL